MGSKFLKEPGSYERDLSQADAWNEWFQLCSAGSLQCRNHCKIGDKVVLDLHDSLQHSLQTAVIILS